MGHPALPYDNEYEEVNECPACRDVIFHGRTPKYLKVLFSGIETCGVAPPTGVIPPLYTTGGFGGSCAWEGWSRDGRFYFNYSPAWNGPLSGLKLFGPGGDLFSGFVEANCVTSFSNDLKCEKGDDYEGGSGSVRWGLKVDEEHHEIW